jgi:hypothetical protein
MMNELTKSPRPTSVILLLAVLATGTFGLPLGAAQSNQSGSNCTSIASNFNGTAIQPGNYVWFNAHIKLNSPAADGLVIYFTNQEITSPGVPGRVLYVPDGQIDFSGSASTATTVYSYSGGTGSTPDYWITTVPVSQGGTIFISGLMHLVTQAAGTNYNNVVWSGCFSSNGVGAGSNCAFELQWQWGAAVYTSAPQTSSPTATGFYTPTPPTPASTTGTQANGSTSPPWVDYNSLGVTSTQSDGLQPGTPTAIEHDVVGGARGGGGANYTGSWSGTAQLSTTCYAGGSRTPPPPPPSCSSSSTMATLTINTVATNGTTISGYEQDIYDCMGNPYASSYSPASVSMYTGTTYTVVADLYSGPCSFAYWVIPSSFSGSFNFDGANGPSFTYINVTLTASSTITAVYYCGETTAPMAASVLVQAQDQDGNPIYGYYIQFFDSTGTNELNDAYSPGFFGQQPATTGTFVLTVGATYQIGADSCGSCQFVSWQDGSTGSFAYTATPDLTVLTATYACT